MSASTVLTLGYGTFSQAWRTLTLGYSLSVPAPQPGPAPGGGGGRISRRRRRKWLKKLRGFSTTARSAQATEAIKSIKRIVEYVDEHPYVEIDAVSRLVLSAAPLVQAPKVPEPVKELFTEVKEVVAPTTTAKSTADPRLDDLERRVRRLEMHVFGDEEEEAELASLLCSISKIH